jgi:hypothetical protein
MNNNDNLLREKENNIPIHNSDMEKNWAALETKLNDTQNTTSPSSTFNSKKIIKWLLVTAAASLIIFVSFSLLKNKNRNTIDSDLAISKSAIKPPMSKINVPYETFTYDAALGDTLFTKNGSIIIFPKNAVMNNKGEIVTGKIEVRSREFNDPLDYYMAGIPMTYDSAGTKYTFVSSGMIDIKAYKNNELLYVNPNAKPQLNLVSTNNEKNTNLYLLDTVTGQWINKGKDEVNDMAINANNPKKVVGNNQLKPKIVSEYPDDFFAEEENKKEVSIIKPLPPQKASGKNPTIEIIIDPESFKELLVYNNLKFEVLNSTTEIVGEDSKTEWDYVELIRSNEATGKYIAKFTEGKKIVQYEVKPVLEGKDYDAAVNVYNEKIKAYYVIQKTRVNNEQKQQDTFALQEKKIDEENKKTEVSNEVVIAKNKIVDIENKRIEELNVLIIARNKKNAEDKQLYLLEIKKQQKINDSIQRMWEGNKAVLMAEMEKQKKISDSMQLIWEKNNKALVTAQKLIRSFEINGFGYWNCDQPTLPNLKPINATFVNNNNYPLDFPSINEAIIGINRLYVFQNNKITVLTNANHVFWATTNNEFYYFTAYDYNKLQFTKPNNATFVMKKYEGQSKNIEDLRKVLFGSYLYGS